jgi:hypothetical protein
MTLGAPHLITSVDFEDTSVTFGARFGIFGQQFGGFDVVWITGMLPSSSSCLDDVAFGTGFNLAETTFPVSRQETAALLGRASPDELSDGTGTGIRTIDSAVHDLF